MEGEGPGRGEPITRPSDLVMNLDERDGETGIEADTHKKGRERESARVCVTDRTDRERALEKEAGRLGRASNGTQEARSLSVSPKHILHRQTMIFGVIVPLK